jgi:hypothetical protein
MKKKSSPGSRFSVSDSVPHKAVLNWHNVPERDLWLYAGSFHKAAKKLAGALELDSGWLSEFDTSPVMFMYRRVIELHLKPGDQARPSLDLQNPFRVLAAAVRLPDRDRLDVGKRIQVRGHREPCRFQGDHRGTECG